MRGNPSTRWDVNLQLLCGVSSPSGFCVASCRGSRRLACVALRRCPRRGRDPTAPSLFQFGFAASARETAESLNSTIGFRVRRHRPLLPDRAACAGATVPVVSAHSGQRLMALGAQEEDLIQYCLPQYSPAYARGQVVRLAPPLCIMHEEVH